MRAFSISGNGKRHGDTSMEKRYRSFSAVLKEQFGCRVHRISLDAGFDCPNRDGAAGSGGCIFCGGKGSGSGGILREATVTGQLAAGREVVSRKYKAGKFLAYFQAYSNTYAPAERLRALYDEALAVEGVCGLIIGTRPDCLPPDVVALLAEYARRTYLWVELGLQSPVDRTLRLLNRGHDSAAFAAAARSLRAAGIRVCAHVILGLPGESREEILAGADYLNRAGVDGVKLHHLHVMKGTVLEGLWRRGAVPLLALDDYVPLLCDYLELLDPRIVIHRLFGDGGENLVAPRWPLGKLRILNEIDRELERRESRQGSRYVAAASPPDAATATNSAQSGSMEPPPQSR